ncbi:MAG TPA: hypothetical protein PKD64_10825 [Pirellulaceae bacterium]|nr:hypothetical protein [Pirellulaceae bacterium]HMO92675.1 hypothetical protein [Pirellulaceae bacterium]HMP70577.1 hypothetical protein [Pirellulaceae bacterium]
MIKDLLNRLDYGVFAELSLVLFVCIFVAVAIRTLLTRSDSANRFANIVLDDKNEEYKVNE